MLASKGLEHALPFATFLIVLIPIESLLPLGLFTLTTHRIIVAMLVLLYMIRGGNSDQHGRKLSMPLKSVIVIQIIWCLVSTANSIDPTASIKKLLSVICEYYALYFVYWKVISKVETIHKILMAMVLGIIVCSVWGAVEAYQNVDIFSYFPRVAHHWENNVEQDREIRIQATYDHPILYGAALAMAITLTFYLLTVVPKNSHRILLWVGLMLMFLNIYKTSSRGPWIGAMVGCSLLFIFGIKQKLLRRNILFIAVLSGMVLIIRPGVWGTIEGLYENTFNNDTNTGSSYAYRPALRHAAVHRLLEDPTTRAVWGSGPESFFAVHLEGMLLGEPHVFLSCDDAWVEFLIETGFVGLSIMLVLLLKPCLVAWKQYRELSTAGRYRGLILFVNFVMFYLQMYTVGLYSWGQNGYALWILIALTFAHSRLSTRQPGHPAMAAKIRAAKQVPTNQEAALV